MENNNARHIQLYQVRDTVGKTVVGPIITTHHPAAATRIFTDALKDEKTSIAAHAADYELICLGKQIEDTGELIACPPEVILTGAQWAMIQNQERGAPIG